MGATTAHSLIQHKAVLGDEHILQIHIFRDNRQPGSDPQPQILFWVDDANPDKINDDDDDLEMPDAIEKRSKVIKVGSTSFNNTI